MRISDELREEFDMWWALFCKTHGVQNEDEDIKAACFEAFIVGYRKGVAFNEEH